ncbi:hypothetical protein IFR35_16415 [Pseudomonas fluorescens]|jgi:hypothetical protein|uniref:hypothetical protein n=1 Tax=Pseudomonas TaxID=286 RepID=UPI000F035099|nr:MULTISPECIES: hypothetical protein [Pseudomonas]MBD8193012.1 hypothetical protein [Pseudomonas fluorescens]MBD8227834.1 hypothetical protein [Pseudomonas fluorescens]MBD8785800.1 hypothetical protein [Pseudomonas fluorescens]MBD8818029.1 hypothetical protein [Pseudomonas fluorescens]
MNLNIQNVTPETVEIQGQTVTRAYAEGIMLTTLVTSAGKNEPARNAIVKQYLDAGLSAALFPRVAAAVRQAAFDAAQERARQVAAAEAHAARHRSYHTSTPLDAARRRAKRLAHEDKMRAMGAAVRAANGSSSFSSSDFD